jgi:hypothetical protein
MFTLNVLETHLCRSLKTCVACSVSWGMSLLKLEIWEPKKKIRPVMTISKIITEKIVENDLGNFNFCSRKLANGKNIMAIRNAKKKGARMLSPKAKRYPKPNMEAITSVSFTRKGSRSTFIIFSVA